MTPRREFWDIFETSICATPTIVLKGRRRLCFYFNWLNLISDQIRNSSFVIPGWIGESVFSALCIFFLNIVSVCEDFRNHFMSFLFGLVKLLLGHFWHLCVIMNDKRWNHLFFEQNNTQVSQPAEGMIYSGRKPNLAVCSYDIMTILV
mgnify:CR=1 FL=1